MTTKFVLIFLVSLAEAFAQPTITTVSYDGLSHSAARIIFGSTGWTGGAGTVRLRYTVSPATCTSGSGGVVQGNQSVLTSNLTMIVLAGLAPGTTYQVCPEISNDGSTWISPAQGLSLTTLALPAVHPIPPLAPASFNTDYPDTTGYTSVTVAANCSDFLSRYNTAIGAQASHGTVINIPAGTVCNASSGYGLFSTAAPDVIKFTGSSSNVNTSTSTITTSTPHGLSEGQMIRFGSNYGCVPGSTSAGSVFCHYQGPIIIGQVYYAHVISSTQLQVYNSGPASSGGSLITLNDVGSGSNYIVGLKSDGTRNLYGVIIRTSTPDSSFVPEHTRVTPQWLPKMAVFQMPASLRGVGNTFISIDDLNVNAMTYGIRFVGIQFTYQVDPYASTSADPQPWDTITAVLSTAQNIVFDRCYWHANGTPERIYRAISWDGLNSAILDSYIDNWEYFHSAYTGLTLTKTSSTSFTIASGSGYFGAGSGTLASTATVNITGAQTGSGTQWAPVYFSMSGNRLNVILPPGLSGTCTGVSNCTVVGSTAERTGVAATGTSGTFPTASGTDYYFIDPVFSSSPTGTSPLSLFSSLPATPLSTGTAAGSPYQLGFRFYSDTNGYISGIRFNKTAADTASTHNVYLWSDTGTLLGTAASSGETTSGWQQANFSSPLAITAGTTYVATWQTSYFSYSSAFWTNSNYSNSPLHAITSYVASNGNLSNGDTWPPDALGRPAAGYIGYAQITAGAITSVGNLYSQTSTYAAEGCQCMTGGKGPGPYVFKDNYVSAVGLPWHHDDSGLNYTIVGDYNYIRDTFHTPVSRMWKGAQSNGMEYFHRQPMEWKKGVRIKIDGLIMDGSWVEDNPASCMICMTARLSIEGIRDVSITNTTFQHGPGLMTLPGQADTTAQNESTAGGHFLFRNNLAWDIQPGYCIASGANCPGQANGWIFEGPTGGEDYNIDHNTFVGNSGRVPSVFHLFDTKIEGIAVTNNFLYLAGGDFGVTIDLVPFDPCSGTGEQMANCKFTPTYAWDHNVMIGNGITQSQLKTAWPNHSANNYFPSNVSLASQGWYSYNSNTGGGDFHLKSNYCSGCGNPASDLKDVGADIDALQAAEGVVTLTGTPASSLTSSGASVAFVAPDSAGCPVDYSSTDPNMISNFTRVADSGGPRARTVLLSGLSGKTLYYYRVNCAVQQPTGQFRTN